MTGFGMLTFRPFTSISVRSREHSRPVDGTLLPGRGDIAARSRGHSWPLGGAQLPGRRDTTAWWAGRRARKRRRLEGMSKAGHEEGRAGAVKRAEDE
jgi:hypothetical protein